MYRQPLGRSAIIRACFSSHPAEVTRTRIKICGITTADDARTAVASGADAIGLVFYPPSPRAVSVEQAAEIAAVVPPFVSVVALFVDEPAEVVTRILERVPVDLIQFHGRESASFCRQFGRPWIKALRVQPGMDLASMCRDFPGARGILLDSWQQGKPGGTGKVFDWELAAEEMALPVVLAGGLDESNVGAAIGRLRPFAVDVSGGVERAPGVKDATAIARFITAVRNADTCNREQQTDDE
jgi:phosphoribosylanthranilate isomerase